MIDKFIMYFYICLFLYPNLVHLSNYVSPSLSISLSPHTLRISDTAAPITKNPNPPPTKKPKRKPSPMP